MESRTEAGLLQFQLIHCRDTETAVNMQDFTGNTAGQIRAEEPGKVWEEGDGQGVRHRQALN